jgi:Transcriptional regulator
MSAHKTPSIPAVVRAFEILEALAGSRNGLSLSQLMELSGIPKSSLHCLLLTLERGGYLHRSARTGRYLFGLKLVALANNSLQNLQIREVAAPHLVRLMEATHLTVHLAVPEVNEAILVAKYDPPGVARLATWRGKIMEINCTGIGKAIGAFLPDEQVEAIYHSRGFPRNNENTLTSLRRVREDFRLIRQRMYSVDNEEDELDHRCLGAPILAADGTVSGAISLAGTTQQITSENLPRFAEKVKACAFAISRAAGYSRNDWNAYHGS